LNRDRKETGSILNPKIHKYFGTEEAGSNYTADSVLLREHQRVTHVGARN